MNLVMYKDYKYEVFPRLVICKTILKYFRIIHKSAQRFECLFKLLVSVKTRKNLSISSYASKNCEVTNICSSFFVFFNS